MATCMISSHAPYDEESLSEWIILTSCLQPRRGILHKVRSELQPSFQYIVVSPPKRGNEHGSIFEICPTCRSFYHETPRRIKVPEIDRVTRRCAEAAGGCRVPRRNAVELAQIDKVLRCLHTLLHLRASSTKLDELLESHALSLRSAPPALRRTPYATCKRSKVYSECRHCQYFRMRGACIRQRRGAYQVLRE
jgi:hypothetical protein